MTSIKIGRSQLITLAPSPTYFRLVPLFEVCASVHQVVLKHVEPIEYDGEDARCVLLRQRACNCTLTGSEAALPGLVRIRRQFAVTSTSSSISFNRAVINPTCLIYRAEKREKLRCLRKSINVDAISSVLPP
jgi:hypothetical protein